MNKNGLATGEYFNNKQPIGKCVNKECDYNKDEGCYFGYIQDGVLQNETWINKCNWFKKDTGDQESMVKDCLSCSNSFSLAAGELYDDGSVEDYDRLVCMEHKRIVGDKDCCNEYN